MDSVMPALEILESSNKLVPVLEGGNLSKILFL